MPNLLILGGTAEARALAEVVAARGIPGQVSLAGRVARPKPLALPSRTGGFGGVPGLVAYLKARAVTHVIDATHPFAAQMSQNALEATAALGLPLLALTRPPWEAGPGDHWTHVPSIAAAAALLAGPPERILLAIGRMHLSRFASQPQHHYVLRLVDPPEAPLDLPNTTVLLDRGPFARASDRALMQEHRITRVVSKNAGGGAAVAKIEAARDLGLPVLMIDRPRLPERAEVHDAYAALHWLTSTRCARGV